jgi:hypothetical protein
MLGAVIQYTICEMNYNFPFLNTVKYVKLTEKRLTNTCPILFCQFFFRYSKS